jgi:hypothetical protein
MAENVWIRKISVLSLSGKVGPGKPFEVSPGLAEKYLAKKLGDQPVYQKVSAPATPANMEAANAEIARLKAEILAKADERKAELASKQEAKAAEAKK